MVLNEFRSQVIEWDKADGKIYEKIKASAGDSNGRKLIVQVLNEREEEDLTGSILSLAWRDSDAQGLDTFSEIDAQKGLYEIYYTTEMLSNVGVLKASLVLVKPDGRIESEPFKIIVQASVVDDEAVQSENSFTVLTEALVTVSQYDNRIYKLEEAKAEKTDLHQTNQDVASLQAEKSDKTELNVTNNNVNNLQINKVDKDGNEQVTLGMLSQEVKEIIAGSNALPAVKENSVNTSNVVNGAITTPKMSDLAVDYRKTNFLSHKKELNLFDGIYERKYLQGSSGELRIIESPKGKFKTFRILPNTYYAIRTNAVYKIKYATSSSFLDLGYPDGEVNISTDTDNLVIKTGPIDNYLYISLTTPDEDFNDSDVFLKVLESKEPVTINQDEKYPVGFNRDYELVDVITADRATFLVKDNKNLFNGAFETRYYLMNLSPELTLVKRNTQTYATFIRDIEPNQVYTILKDPTEKEDGYRYFKVATSTKTASELRDLNVDFAMDGSYQFSRTSDDVERHVFSSGADDRSVVITVAKTARPYVELLQGTHSKMIYNSYEGHINPDGLNIYNKNEVDELMANVTNEQLSKSEKLYVKKTSESDMMIYHLQNENRGIGYRYQRYISTRINVDVWRSTDIYICDRDFNHLHSITTGDNEGVLKISGEVDYLGSVHGDEIGTASYLFIDGCEIPITSNFEGWCNSVEFIIASDIFRADSDVLAFKKIKNVVYDRTGVHIKNQWTAEDSYLLHHVRGTLLSIMKKDGEKTLIGKYSSNVNLLPNIVPDGSGSIENGNSSEISSVNFYGGIVSAKIWAIERNSANIKGSIANFGERLKAYIDSYVDENIEKNQVIFDEHKYQITVKNDRD